MPPPTANHGIVGAPPNLFSVNIERPPKGSRALDIRPPRPPVLTTGRTLSPNKQISVSPKKLQHATPASASAAVHMLSSFPTESATEPSLDIYAPSYIPLYLKAVNDSVAILKFSIPLEAVNYEDYISSFAGRQYVQPLENITLPKIQDVAVAHSPPLALLSPETYGLYFWEALQKEVFAEASELPSSNMYEAHLDCQDASKHLFRLKVPGIRESSPLVEIGDTILLRPFGQDPNAAQLTDQWYAPGGGRDRGLFAPIFYGSEFHAIVWGIVRQKEEILVQAEGLTCLTCNVIFLPQHHRIAPLARSITFARTSLQASSFLPTSDWFKRMLFPALSDAVEQRHLPAGTFPSMDWFDQQLNYEQQKAVHATIKSDYGGVPYLISGPPGTGKTKTIVEITLQLVNRPQKAAKHDIDFRPVPHILVCAPSDPAADTLALRLSKHLAPAEMFRLNVWSRSSAEVPASLLPYTYVDKDLFSLPAFDALMSYKVVVTTCRGAAMLVQAQVTNHVLGHLARSTLRAIAPRACDAISDPHLLHWTALLIDEAGQATEPEALIPLAVIAPSLEAQAGNQDASNWPQFVMAGDEHQLGPRLFSKRNLALSTSMFARLFSRPFYLEHPLSRQNGSKGLTAAMLPIARPAFTNLIWNYRSHPSILSVPSQLFYGDTLVPEYSALSTIVGTWPGWKSPHKWPVLFVRNTDPNFVESILEGNGTGAGALLNYGEVSKALRLVKGLLQHRVPNSQAGEYIRPDEITLMSPFEAQVRLLRKSFREHDLYDVNIGPLEAFQGLESRIVLICTTRTRSSSVAGKDMARFVKEDQEKGLGVIGEPKRFNVAVTRAKEGLIVLGDPETLTVQNDPCWTNFLGFCARNDCFSCESAESDSDVNWIKRFAQREGVHAGRLERALNFAAYSKANENGRKGQKGSGDAGSQPAREKSRFSQRGPMPTMDDEMWKEGLRMAEKMNEVALIDDGDADEEGNFSDVGREEKEEVDPWSGDLLELAAHPAISPTSATVNAGADNDTSARIKRVFSTSSAGDFDRDPRREFERTDCATQ